MQRILTTLTVLLLTPISAFCAGELKLAAMFSDHMILHPTGRCLCGVGPMQA
jgi:hypothetical protein